MKSINIYRKLDLCMCILIIKNKGLAVNFLQGIFQVLKSKGIKEFCFDSGYKEAQQMWTNKFGNPNILLKDYWGEGEHHMIWRRQVDNVLK